MKTKTVSLSKLRIASSMALLLAWTLPNVAFAQDAEEEEPVGERTRSGLGLAPGIPQVSALAGGFTPAYSPVDADNEAWHADFHGFISMPLNIGFNKRAGETTDDQYSTVMHAPPEVPEYRDAFTYTSVIPNPYAQLNFGYGNSYVMANVIVQARTASTGRSYFDSTTTGGISDAYVTFTPPKLSDAVDFMAHVGAFTNRYGATGQYDEGRYGQPLFARTNGVGENIIAFMRLGDNFSLELQQGFQGQIDKAPLGITPGDWNDYADPNIGSSFVHHAHAGFGIKDFATIGAHYMHAWTADERANQGTIPDGKMDLIGGDLRLTMGRWGHFYGAGTYLNAKNSRSVGYIIDVLNASGGPGLMRNYFGPNSNGTGKLLIMGGQYDLSLARAIYGSAFEGQSPDIFISLFGQRVQVQSDDQDYDGITKQKFGIEAGYSLLKWFATSLRFDHVDQDLSDSDESFNIISPRLIFRTNWQSRDQVTIQYSHWFNGSEVYVRSGTPATLDPSINPDEDVLSINATMWW